MTTPNDMTPLTNITGLVLLIVTLGAALWLRQEIIKRFKANDTKP
jgi:hypothetical protein